MASNLLQRYIWIVDTIKRLGRVTRCELDRRWAIASCSEGESRIPRRTFYNYRQAIEELFSISIQCDPSTKEYYIAEEPESAREQITNWVLNTSATSFMLQDSRDLASRIMLEEVPSAREHLQTMFEALRENRAVCFDYHPYSRVNPTRDVHLEPWFMRLYRQIWYVTGREVSSGRDKTYALDRVSGLRVLDQTFTPPADAEPKLYFRDAYGIMVDKGTAKKVVLRVESRQAKYLRALPLHPSQQEEVNDSYSRFTYRLCLTGDFVSEILSMGSDVTVESPRELRAMVVTRLRDTLRNYETPTP